MERFRIATVSLARESSTTIRRMSASLWSRQVVQRVFQSNAVLLQEAIHLDAGLVAEVMLLRYGAREAPVLPKNCRDATREGRVCNKLCYVVV